MIQKYWYKYISFFTLSIITINIYATNLVQVFRQALNADPELQMTKFNSLSNEQQTPIKRAALLPNFAANGEYYKQNANVAPGISPNSSTLSLTISQPLFNVADWLNYQSAKMVSCAAKASYGAALQDLIIRTAQAYFDVLQAQDELRFSKTNHTVLAEILRQNQLRFNAGLVKIVDVDSARAAYTASDAKVYADQINLTQKLGNLQAITGVAYLNLAPLLPHIPLINLQPKNLSAWLTIVNQQNLTVLADRYTAESDKINIQAQSAGHYPTLSADAGYTHNLNHSVLYPNPDVSSVGVKLSLPLYAGGQVNAQTRQAAYQFQSQLGQAALDYRTAINQAQASYIGVVEGINEIMSDEKTVTADQRAVKSTRIAYRAGISQISISDLLNAQATLYQAQRDAVADKYAYIINSLKLKEAAGTLSINDVFTANNWLKK